MEFSSDVESTEGSIIRACGEIGRWLKLPGTNVEHPLRKLACTCQRSNCRVHRRAFRVLESHSFERTKGAELRQAWIDGLRQDLAAHIAAVFAVKYLVDAYHYQHGRKLKYVDLAEAISEPHVQASTTFHRILLRLNPDDKSTAQKELIEQLNKLRECFVAEEYENACNCTPAIREKGQSVLKAEWERVKQGEPIFRWSKRLALLLVLSVIAFGGFFTCQMRTDSHTGITPHTAPSSQGATPTATAWPNQSMKPTAPLRSKLRVLATAPCRGLSLSR